MTGIEYSSIGFWPRGVSRGEAKVDMWSIHITSTSRKEERIIDEETWEAKLRNRYIQHIPQTKT